MFSKSMVWEIDSRSLLFFALGVIVGRTSSTSCASQWPRKLRSSSFRYRANSSCQRDAALAQKQGDEGCSSTVDSASRVVQERLDGLVVTRR